jgi:hypothetical protein
MLFLAKSIIYIYFGTENYENKLWKNSKKKKFMENKCEQKKIHTWPGGAV